MASITFTNSLGVATTLLDSNVVTQRINGVESAPNFELSTAPLVRQDGDKVIGGAYKARPIMLEGTLVDSSTTNLRTRLDNLKRDVSGPGTLDITFDGDTAKRYQVNVVQVMVTNEHYQLTWVPFSIQFEAHDPPFGEDLESIEVYSANDSSADIEETDDFDGSAAPNVDIQIAVSDIGNLVAIELRNKTTVTSLEVAPAAWVAGDILSYRSGPGTLLLNGLPHDFTGVLPKFVPGSNDWAINYRSDNVDIDTEQTVHNTDRFAFGDILLAQSVEPSANITASRVDLLLSKLGNPTSVVLKLYTDDTDAPDAPIAAAQATVLGSNISTIPSWVSFNLESFTALSSGTKYWIVLEVSGAMNDVNNGIYWKVSSTSVYASHNYSKSTDSGSTWAADANVDATFKLWKNSAIASNSNSDPEVFSEDFSTTTNKDAGATTANWDTANTRVVLGTNTDNNLDNNQTTVTDGQEFTFGDTSRKLMGQFFRAGTTGAICRVSASLFKVASPTDFLRVKIYAASNGGGSLSVTSATPIATSTTLYDGSTLPSYPAPVSLANAPFVDFDFDGTVPLTSGSYYLMSIERNGAYDNTNRYGWSAAGTDVDATGGIASGSASSTWPTGSPISNVSNPDMTYRTYYKLYDPTEDDVQSGTLNAAGATFMATVNVKPVQTLQSGTDIDYSVQSDATTGFESVTADADTFLTPPGLISASVNHKWKGLLTGTASATPVLDSLEIEYRKAMPLDLTTDRLAQSFASGPGGDVAALVLNLTKTSADTIDYTIEIHPDSAGSPSGTPITDGTATIQDTAVAVDSFGWVQAIFATPPTLTAATTYWIVVKVGSAGSSKLLWRARGANAYADGTAKYSANSGSAYTTLTNEDFLFQVLATGSTFINDVSVSYKPRWL